MCSCAGLPAGQLKIQRNKISAWHSPLHAGTKLSESIHSWAIFSFSTQNPEGAGDAQIAGLWLRASRTKEIIWNEDGNVEYSYNFIYLFLFQPLQVFSLFVFWFVNVFLLLLFWLVFWVFFEIGKDSLISFSLSLGQEDIQRNAVNVSASL